MLFVYFKASACDRFCTFTWYFQDVILTWIPPCFAPYLIWLILSWEYTWSNKYFSWWRVLGVTHLQTAQMGQAAAWPRRSWGETIQKMEDTVFKYVTLKNWKTVILMTTFCSWISPPPSVPSSHRTWCRKKTTFCPVLNTDLWLLCKILERRMQGSTGEQCPTVMTARPKTQRVPKGGYRSSAYLKSGNRDTVASFWRCGNTTNHPWKNCPTKDTESRKCKRNGHFAQKCQSAGSVHDITDDSIDCNSGLHLFGRNVYWRGRCWKWMGPLHGALAWSWCQNQGLKKKKRPRHVDMTHLNEWVQRERHILPNVHHSLMMLMGGKIFSKLDAMLGVWQILLTEDSTLVLSSHQSVAIVSTSCRLEYPQPQNTSSEGWHKFWRAVMAWCAMLTTFWCMGKTRLNMIPDYTRCWGDFVRRV